jgi:hypothetical protein
MLERKLVTLACAAGILASGACFLPPLPNRAPASPPIALDLQGVKNIGVRVINKSSVQRLSASDVAGFIERRLALEGRRAHLAAYPAGDDTPQDAVLQVTILSESATPAAYANGTGIAWDLNVSASAVLTKTGGRVIWQETDESYHIRYETRQESEDALWKEDPVAKSRLSQGVANRLVFRLLTGQ